MSGFVFSGSGAEASDVMLEFADGHHVVPKWIVAHLGGTEAVTSEASMQKARTVNFEEFLRRFHSAVSASALRDVQEHIVSSHLQRLKPNG